MASPAINARLAADISSPDMDDQARDQAPDIGADERSNTPIILRPVVEQDVGPLDDERPVRRVVAIVHFSFSRSFYRCLSATLFGLFFCLVSATAFLPPCLAGELIIYLDPRGSDASDGLTEHRPVASLQKALQIAESISANEVSALRIAVAPGEYRGQTAKARGNFAGLEIAPISTDPTRPRPRFDGDRKGGTWLDIRSATGTRTNYKISGLEITNYETAINFAGDRNHRARSNGGNEIRNNVFANIGQIARADAPPSTAVVRLVNSDDNVIASNRFIHIVNPARCALLHSIYVAHDSTGNVIEDNVFEDSCGDAVRFRDGSHSNLVRGNTFIDAWANAPVSDWYCDSEKRTDCTKPTPECPSMNNVIDNNRVVARKLKPAPSFLSFGEDIQSTCSSDADDKRFVIK